MILASDSSAAAAGDNAWPEILIPLSGGSMAPFLRDGDRLIVFIGPTSVGRELGDIVVARQEDGWVAHRIVGLGGGYLLKGERSYGFDGRHTSVLGVVTGVMRGERTFYWGLAGPKLKGLMAGLSRAHAGPETLSRRLRRCLPTFFQWVAATATLFASKRPSRPNTPR